MINISKYEADKAKGLVALAKVGDAYMVSKKKFDQETGEILPPEVEALDKKDLIAKNAELSQAVKQIDIILAELEHLG
ncbi:MAG: hypothetical protein NTZ97_01145 [Candidatus Moranbacteria bacterium]|nr:hypothetical protein [Candidatus Moranbacteria bacterium]